MSLNDCQSFATKCPACGKDFRVTCRRDEWGYAWKGQPCCSYSCMRAIKREHVPNIYDKERRKKAYEMHKAGMLMKDIAKELGYASVSGVEWGINAYSAWLVDCGM